MKIINLKSSKSLSTRVLECIVAKAVCVRAAEDGSAGQQMGCAGPHERQSWFYHLMAEQFGTNYLTVSAGGSSPVKWNQYWGDMKTPIDVSKQSTENNVST